MSRVSALRRASAPSVAEATLQEVLHGLTRTPKTLPCKLFYDAQGSELFEQICELDEYYLTRTELGILKTNIQSIAAATGPQRVLVEYGSGASVKTRLLLDAMPKLVAYVPIDICEPALSASREVLSKDYPNLPIWPVCGDYTAPLALPAVLTRYPVVGFFPGSTIGNFHPAAAAEFLTAVRMHCGPAGKLLIGVDLQKDESTLLAAYDDKCGTTARFNLNSLKVLNREYNAYFRLDEFEHRAVWNADHGRIEMHLVSKSRQTVQVDSTAVRLEAGESIITEYCYKYSLPRFRELCERSGFTVKQTWLDANQWFSVHLMAVD